MAVRPNGRGGYEADFRDQTGKRIQKTFSKKKDAEDYERDARAQVRQGKFIADSDETIGDKADEWLKRKKATKGYRFKTLQNWEIHITKHIKPVPIRDGKVKLGDLPIQQATVKDIEDAAFAIAAYSSAHNANEVLKTLTAIFFLAQRYGPLDPQGTNVAKLAERLKIATEEDDDGEVQPEDVFSGDEVGKLILATEPGTKDRLLIELGAFCGLRIGEIEGFTWPAIDLKSTHPKVRVIKNLVSEEKGKSDFPGYGKTGRSLKDPKSKASRRSIDAPKELVHDLKLWKLKCPQTEHQLVMATEEGVPIQTKAAQAMLDRACEKAEVPRRTLHRLRHTFASLLLMRGVPLIEVSRLLGHRDIAITAKVYAHFIERQSTSVQDLASMIMGGSRK